MMTRTIKTPLTSILATLALVGYVCLLMTCLAGATEGHCDDDHCSELGECHCACGLWGLSHTEPAVPMPSPVTHIDVISYHPEPLYRVDDLFRPPRAIPA